MTNQEKKMCDKCLETFGENQSCPCSSPIDTEKKCECKFLFSTPSGTTNLVCDLHSSPSLETRIDNMVFPTYTDYGCDGMDECCGNCGGEKIDEFETKIQIKKLISTILEEKAKLLKDKKMFIPDEVYLNMTNVQATIFENNLRKSYGFNEALKVAINIIRGTSAN